MGRYIVGKLNIDGIQNISEDNINTIEKSDVILALDKENCADYVKWHVIIDMLLRNKNNIIALDFGVERNIIYAIFMYLISNRCYKVYTVETDVVDEEYIDIVIEREPNVTEVENYFSDKYFDYNAVKVALVSIGDALNSGDKDKVEELIKSSKDIFGEAFAVFDFIKATNDKLVYNAGTSNNVMNEEKIQKYEESVRQLEEKHKVIDDENKALRSAVMKKDQEMEGLLAKAGNRGSGITMYKTIMTSTIPCKVKVVMYIKEITYATYANTLITTIFDTLRSKNSKIKLMIYDSKNDFSAIYKPLRLVGTTEYTGDKESLINKTDKFVVMEPNPNIMTDVLKTELDLLIVYDRLKYKNDIVEGNNVKKFFVINSKSDYDNLKINGVEINSRSVITRPDVLPESLGIASLDKYAEQSDVSRLSSYNMLYNCNSEKEEFLIKTILGQCGLQMASRRK